MILRKSASDMADGKDSPPSSTAQNRGCGSPISLPPLTNPLGLNNSSTGTDQPVPSNLKETDSPFVRLSKLGGQKNLLAMDQGEVLKKQTPVAYPRNQWYYHLDNAKEDAAKKPALHYQPAYYVDGKEFLPKIPPHVPGTRMPKRDPSSSQLLPGQVPSTHFPKVVPKKPIFSASPIRGKKRKPRVYGPNMAKAGGSGMNTLAQACQQDWKDQMQAHYTKLQTTTAPRTFKPATEYERSFGPALLSARRKESQKAAVKSMLRLPAKKQEPELDTMPNHEGCKGLTPGKKNGGRFVLNKFKKVGPKIDFDKKRSM